MVPPILKDAPPQDDPTESSSNNTDLENPWITPQKSVVPKSFTAPPPPQYNEEASDDKAPLTQEEKLRDPHNIQAGTNQFGQEIPKLTAKAIKLFCEEMDIIIGKEQDKMQSTLYSPCTAIND